MNPDPEEHAVFATPVRPGLRNSDSEKSLRSWEFDAGVVDVMISEWRKRFSQKMNQRPKAVLLSAPIAILVVSQTATLSSQNIRNLAEAYFKNPRYEQVSLAPDGSHIAYFSYSKDQKLLSTYDFDSMEFKAIPGLPAQRSYQYSWIDEDHMVVALARPGREGLTLGSVDEDLTATTALMEDDPVQILQAAPSRPMELFAARHPRVDRYPDVLKFRADSNTPLIVEQNPGDVIKWVLDSNGEVKVCVVYKSGSASRLKYRPDDGSAWEALDLPPRSNPLFLNKSGEVLFLSQSDGRDTEAVSMFNLKEKRTIEKPYAHPAYDIGSVYTELLADQKSGAVVGFIHQTEKPIVVYFTNKYRQLQAMVNTALPKSLNRILGYSSDGSLMVETESDRTPRTCCLLNPETGVVTPFFPSRPWLESKQMSVVHPISFPSRDGSKLHGYLTLPQQREKDSTVPMIVKVHGGPEQRDIWEFDPEVQFFARLGYAVLQVNYRGSIGYGKAYHGKSFLKTCRFAVEDVADAVRWSIEQGYSDPKRIAIVGGSFGAYAALAGAAFEPKLYRCAIGYAGIYDWQLPMSDEDRGILEGQILWKGGYQKEVRKQREKYRKISPIHAAQKMRAAVLLVHPGDDVFAFKKQAMAMRNALRKGNKVHEMIVNTRGSHGSASTGIAGSGGTQDSILDIGTYTLEELIELTGTAGGGRRAGQPTAGATLSAVQSEKKLIQFYIEVAEFLRRHL